MKKAAGIDDTQAAGSSRHARFGDTGEMVQWLTDRGPPEEMTHWLTDRGASAAIESHNAALLDCVAESLQRAENLLPTRRGARAQAVPALAAFYERNALAYVQLREIASEITLMGGAVGLSETRRHALIEVLIAFDGSRARTIAYVDAWIASGSIDFLNEALPARALFIENQLTLADIDRALSSAQALAALDRSVSDSDETGWSTDSDVASWREEGSDSMFSMLGYDPSTIRIARDAERDLRHFEHALWQGDGIENFRPLFSVGLHALQASSIRHLFGNVLHEGWFEAVLTHPHRVRYSDAIFSMAVLNVSHILTFGDFSLDWVSHTNLGPETLADLIDSRILLERIGRHAALHFQSPVDSYVPVSPLFDRLLLDPMISDQRAQDILLDLGSIETALQSESAETAAAALELLLSQQYGDGVVAEVLGQIAQGMW